MRTLYDSDDNQVNLLELKDIESNSNYIKFPDGTLICMGNFKITYNLDKGWLNHFYQYCSVGVTFPVPFVSTPFVHVGNKSNLLTTCNAYDFNNTRLDFLYLVSPEKINGTVDGWYTAIGRWK